jgi:V/A-type H+/Na+-transporting ATPase subunit E
MAVQVQEIIDRIRTEGIDGAKAEAERINAEALKRAQGILADAEARAKALITEAGAKAVRETEAGKAALAQAARDTILLLKKEIQGLLDAVVAHDAKAAMKGDALKELLPAALKAMASGQGGAVISLSEEDHDKLAEYFRSSLSSLFKEGVELKSNPRLKSGFRVSLKDGGAYCDFSAEAAADALCQLLNPALADIMRAQAGKA